MIAAFLEEPKSIKVKEITTPDPAYGEVRVKLHQIGICGSDVHLFLGHRKLDEPTIIGHEGIGFIDKVGEGVNSNRVGERVVIEPNIPCHKCEYCYTGKSTICPNKQTIGLNKAGCFAEYVVLPADYAWNIPSEISDEDALCIEPMAAALHALFKSKAKPGDVISVIGLGAIGLLLTHLALSLGYTVLVTEINADKLQLAIGQGAIAVESDMLEKTWEDNHVSVVFECAGAAKTVSLATAHAPRGAEIVLVGLSNAMAELEPLKIVRAGITIIPSLIYDHFYDYKRTIQLIKAGIIAPKFIISSYHKLEDLQNALELAASGKESKIIVKV